MVYVGYCSDVVVDGFLDVFCVVVGEVDVL